MESEIRAIILLWDNLMHRSDLDMWANSKILCKLCGVKLKHLPFDDYSDEKGIRFGRASLKSIELRDMKNLQDFITLIHEIGHVRLKHLQKINSGQLTEIEAETEVDIFTKAVCLHIMPQHAGYIEISCDTKGRLGIS